jgi:PBSX family phage portal protein
MPIRSRFKKITLPKKQAASARRSRSSGAARLASFGQKRTGYTAPYVNLLQKAQGSKQLSDPFEGRYFESVQGAYAPISPIYPFHRLCQLPIENNILRQCIEAYVVNIESFGYFLEYIGPEGKQNSKEAVAEKQRLEAFLSAPSPENSLRQIREKARWDYEVLGNAFFEISRDLAGRVQMFDHIPANTMRLTRRDKEPTVVTIMVKNPAGEGYVEKEVNRHFRRFVQIGPTGKRVYFKEYGDPRRIDPETGLENPNLDIEDEATEVIHLALYAPGSVYGLPRWIGQLPSIMGSRESEIVNLNFFRENAIPAMAVLVSGGALTDETFQRISDYINSVKGRDSMQRVMIIEAAADDSAGSVDHSQPAPKIDMKPMISERQQDGLFKDYDDHNQAKVRSAFRLPPIYVGRAEDYTRASALASMITAENQIFLPERMCVDDLINNKVIGTHQPRHWRFKSFGASLAEPDSMSKMITTFGTQGALTPNAVIKIANKMLDIQIEQVNDAWGDYPFQVITTLLQNGAVIKGLDGFIKSMENAGEGEQQPPANSNKPLAAAARKVVKSEIATLGAELKEMIGDALQTFAAKAA